MAGPMLLFAALVQAITAAAYLYVGRATSLRRVTPDASLAARMFSLWWYTLGGLTAVGAARLLAAYFGFLDLGLHLTLVHLTLLALCVALWGLLYYLVYLFTGDRRWFVPLSAFYAAFYVWTVYLLALSRPTGVVVLDTGVSFAYGAPLAEWLVLAYVAVLVVPPVVGAIGYARLFFRVRDRTHRYRIGLVSATIVAWFGLALAGQAIRLTTSAEWQHVSRFFGLAAALLILAAFRPPAWVRRRWRVAAIDEPEAT